MQIYRTLTALAVTATLGGCLTTGTEDAVSPRVTGFGPELSAFEVPEGYTRLFSPALHNYRTGLSAAGDPVRRGMASERFELRDSDCGGGDCVAPRARAEIQLENKANPAQIGKDIWYGWSFLNASVPSFTRANSLRLIFGQWTVGNGEKPIIRLIQLGKDEGDFSDCPRSICAGLNGSTDDLVVQLEDIAHARGWGDAENNGYICRLFDMKDKRGKWVDMTVNTNFSTGDDGYLKVWVDGRLKCNYKGPLVSVSSAATGRPPQHRRGVYSSWDKRWVKDTNGAPKPTLIVYYDEFRMGDTRESVDVQTASINGLSPVE